MIRFHALTHPGKVRANNEDAMFSDGHNGVFIVADGVGGRAAGEVASRITIETFQQSTPDLASALDHYAVEPIWERRNKVLNALESVCQRASKHVFPFCAWLP